MKTIFRLFIITLLIANVTEMRAEKVKMNDSKTRTLKGTTAGCTPSSTFAWLNINNARVRVNAGGDMWWDLPGGTGAKYYIPANSSMTSIYAGSLWIAGMDVNGQLKCAAIRFRQVGNDFWTGPLTIDGTASIDAATCMEYDKMYNITRAEVDDFRLHCDENGVPESGYDIPANIINWPAHGPAEKGMSHYLAPFYDNDGDGEYNPAAGDYPYYDINNELCHSQVPTMDEEIEGSVKGSTLADQVIKGDQTIWWVFNDKGNSHTETGGSAIGMEIRAQAFAFATNDEINNMTFYSYEIINRSTYTLTNTYFSPWTDVDLGYAKDDFVGCDVQRGLGYGYNGSNVDGKGQTEAYGENPPAVGVDFFQGPYLDPDGVDNPKYDANGNQLCNESINGVNFGNGIVDDERFGMRRFVYHNNTGSDVNGDPEKAAEYYQLLRGIWKNGEKMQYGGNAVPNQPGTVGPECDFMFPFDSDPCNWGTGGLIPNGGFNQNGFYWSEETGNNGGPNDPEDRRFMQSAGPFTLKSGAVNYITFGVPWARATTGKAWASVELLRRVDDKCQAMFDNCFDVIDGPDAPDLTIQEYDRQLVIFISNSETSNNFMEGYEEKDPNLTWVLLPGDSTKYCDSMYRFEGYQLYQLANSRISVDELNDETKARLIYQCDVKNGVGTIINHVYDETLGFSVPTLMVEGGDNGVKHSVIVTQDAFTTDKDVRLVNHKTYYFMAIAYAYNNFLTYNADPSDPNALNGQKEPYLSGRKNIKMYSAVPHKIVNGTVINSDFGSTPVITRYTGFGNGGNQLELSDATVKEILSKAPASDSVKMGHPDYPMAYHPVFKEGYGPVKVSVIDPLNVVGTDYALYFDDFQSKYITKVTNNPSVVGDSAAKTVFNWYLKDLNTGEVFMSDATSDIDNEQLFVERGISIDVKQPWHIGPKYVGTNGTDASTGDPIAYYSVLATNNGLITSSVTYADSSSRWMSGIKDENSIRGSALNWIRAGSYGDQDDRENNDYLVKSDPYAKGSKPYDPDGVFETIGEGTWAPYLLTNVSGKAGAFNPGPFYSESTYGDRTNQIFARLGSIDVVLTADKSLWTRCPVVEMCMDKNLSEGNVERFTLRKHASIDKNGNPCEDMGMEPSDNPEDPNYIAADGMGWFPGYAIDVESGARLNLIYGEDSFHPELNGRDMMFNPAAIKENTALGMSPQQFDPVLFDPIDGTALFAGKHFVYVLPLTNDTTINNKIVMGNVAYDAGKRVYNIFHAISEQPASQQKVYMNRFWAFPGWVGMPVAIEGKPWLQEGNPVKVSIRIAMPYREGYALRDLEVENPDLTDTTEHKGLLPYYEFSTNNFAPAYNDAKKGAEDRDLICVIPNPYYAYSYYEENNLTHCVKIANLPDQCVVTIYNMAGTKIRQFKKDDSSVTSIDWDLTNFANTPIASGFYLIHVKDKVNGGEKIVKFYCAIRQVDLNTF